MAGYSHLGKTVVLLATAALTVPMLTAAAVSPASVAPRSSVTFLLAPNDQAALTQLASAQGLTQRQRQQELAHAEPSTATRAQVISVLDGAGLRIQSQTIWSITATGPATVVTGLVGSLRQKRVTGRAQPLTAHLTTAGAGVPELQGLIIGVAGGDDIAPVATPRAPSFQSGSQLRSVYSAPLGVTPTGSPLTVATIQFSGWNSADLSSYAARIHVPDPVANKTYQAISIDGQGPTVANGTGGQEEVALDQESLLAVAPYAHQRAYFAPNSTLGFVDALLQVAQDATDASHKGYGLAALSISWGNCEQDWGSDMTTIDQALQSVLAAGVTVFASSGDNGIHDCASDSTLVGVDFPASDPNVVGVGGTTVDGKTQTAWSGSGGGTSNWPAPQFQSALGGAHRLVPDIAADADPQSGFVIISGGYATPFGGTSLASPISAGMFANTLARHGWSSGVGNILPSLYRAPKTSFNDIVTGYNGNPAHVGYDEVTGLGAPLWSRLADSYDGYPTLHAPFYSRSRTVPIRVTLPSGMTYRPQWHYGVGTAPAACTTTGTVSSVPATITVPHEGRSTLWVQGIAGNGGCYHATVSVMVDGTRPTIRSTAGLTARNRSSVAFHWLGADHGSGLSHYAVTITHNGSSVPDYRSANTTSTSRWIRGIPGRTYTISVTAIDRAGNSAATSTRLKVPVHRGR